MDYTIANYQPEDVRDVLKMHRQSWLDTYPNEDFGVTIDMINQRFDAKSSDEEVAKTQQRIIDEANDSDHLSLVAKSKSGDAVGFVFATKSSGYGEVNAIYVDKEYHGRGLGADLMKRALEFLGDEKPIHIHVAVYNERAKSFYRKFGFIEQGPVGTENFPQIPELLFIKTI